MLSGLGAEAMTAPIGTSWRLSPDLNFVPQIERDLGLPGASFEEDLPDEENIPIITTDIALDDADGVDQLLLAEKSSSGSRPVPEPPLAATLLVGIALVAGATQLGRRKRIHYRGGRRLTVLR